MKAFKYLIFFILLFPIYTNAAMLWSNPYSSSLASSALQACRNGTAALGKYFVDVEVNGPATAAYCYYSSTPDSPHLSSFIVTLVEQSCPSATEKVLKVGVNSKTYVCVAGCQYRLRACVDVDMEPGMTCDAISTGQDCGTTPPPPTPDPSGPPTPDPATPDPADPNGPPPQNTSQSESTSTSTSHQRHPNHQQYQQ